MNIIFFGTPDYVVPLLEGLHKEYNRTRDRELIGVVTQSPKPAGREKQLEYSAVDTFAHAHKIPKFFEFDELPDADLGICAAYGRIIPQHVIERFPLGILNIHPSLLPQWRGASPTQAAIVAGQDETGVSVLKMDADMDHGPIVSSFKSHIDSHDSNDTLRARLFEETIPFLLDLIPQYVRGKISLKEQNHADATFTKTIKKDDGYIPSRFIKLAIEGTEPTETFAVHFMNEVSLSPTAAFIDRFVRALTPWPGVWTQITIDGQVKRLKILEVHAEGAHLFIDTVQLEGKNQVSWKQFNEGYPSISWEQEYPQSVD